MDRQWGESAWRQADKLLRELDAYRKTGLTPEDVARAVRERDAAVEYLRESGDCDTCLHYCEPDDNATCGECGNAMDARHWQWRGVREGGAQ